MEWKHWKKDRLILVIIRNIVINGFGKIGNLEIKPIKGFNVIYGDNEAGKSTIQWFIKGMFYGLKGGREKNGILPPLKRFIPWNFTNYGGLIEYSIGNNEIYTVIRDFSNNTVRILDSSFNDITNTFEIGKDKSVKFAEAHFGLNEVCFEKSVFIKQMEVKVEGSDKEEVLSKLINMSESGFDDISFKRAEKALKDALLTYVGTEKSSSRPLDKVNERLKELREELIELENKRFMILNIEEKLKDSVDLLENYKIQKELLSNFTEVIDIVKIVNENEGVRKELEDIKEELLKNLKTFMENMGGLDISISKLNNRNDKLSIIDEELINNNDKLNIDADNLNYEYEKCKEEIMKLNNEYDKKQRIKRIIDSSFLISLIALIISAVLSVILNLNTALNLNLDLSSIKSILGNNNLSNSNLFNIILGVSDIFSLIVSVSLFITKRILIGAVRDVADKKNKLEEQCKLIRYRLEQIKAVNVNLSNTAEYLIKRVFALTGSNIEFSANDINSAVKVKKIAENIEKEIGEIKTQNSHLINDAVEQVRALGTKIINIFGKNEKSTGRNIMQKIGRDFERDVEQDIKKNSGSYSGDTCVSNDKAYDNNYKTDENYIWFKNIVSALQDIIYSSTYSTDGKNIISGAYDESTCGGCIDAQYEYISAQDKIKIVETEVTKYGAAIDENIYKLSLSIKEYETIVASSGFNDYKLQKVTESIKELEEKRDNLLKLKFSLNKALEVLAIASEEIKKEYLPALNERMSFYISKMTDGKYFDLRANDVLELMILISNTSKIVPVGYLSNGTMDQIYLAFRLALSDIFSPDGEKLPIIMDEVFAQYDDSRIEKTLNLFRELSKERQIFLFTCKKREVEIAKEIFKNDLNLIMLS